MFGSSFILHTTFNDVNGLTKGNNVRYSGIDVGTVENIDILNDTTIFIEMIIKTEMIKFIRKNSLASVGTDGLMGNKLVNITAGTSEVPTVNEYDTIASVRGVNTDAMLRTLEYTNQNVAFISLNLKAITENVNKSRGTLYTVLMDTTLALSFKNTLTNIEHVSNNLNSISERLNNLIEEAKTGSGMIASLLSDSSLASEFKITIKKAKEGSESLSAISKEINQLISQINQGKGTASLIVNDTAMANDLKQSISNIRSASLKLDEDLEGLKHSFPLKKYYNKQEKEKEKAGEVQK
jgi:phospholipid/cholesterol/gamma-HCH transport system substrate-binding protein